MLQINDYLLRVTKCYTWDLFVQNKSFDNLFNNYLVGVLTQLQTNYYLQVRDICLRIIFGWIN